MQIHTIDLKREERPLLSINWSHQDPAVEIVNPQTGRVSPNSPVKNKNFPEFSRICKSSTYFRFKKTCKEVMDKKLGYQEAKMENKEMATAKKALKKSIEVADKGRWVESELKHSIYNWVK